METSGPVIKVVSLDAGEGTHPTEVVTVLDGQRARVTRTEVREGSELVASDHHGEVIMLCLTGGVTISLEDANHRLESGQLLHVLANAPYRIRGISKVSRLVTFVPHAIEVKRTPRDEVDQAAMQSFPASDPPAFTSSTAVGAPPAQEP